MLSVQASVPSQRMLLNATPVVFYFDTGEPTTTRARSRLPTLPPQHRRSLLLGGHHGGAHCLPAWPVVPPSLKIRGIGGCVCILSHLVGGIVIRQTVFRTFLDSSCSN